MPRTRADPEELIDLAWEASSDATRTKLARQALNIDPEAIDAYNLLALGAQSPIEQIALLRQAVAIGRRRWATEIKRPAQHPFWLDIDTRPFMRAVHHLAILLWAEGEKREAVELAEFLLKLNRDDNLGMRYLALAWYGALEEHEAVGRLLKRYRADAGTDFLYARVLDAFRSGADAGPLLDEAVSANPYVPGFLLMEADRLPPESSADYVEMGSPDEAAAYVGIAWDAWSKVPGALGWLASRLGDDSDTALLAAEASGLIEFPYSGHGEELDELLSSGPDPDKAMLLGELDGYLAGILISPHDPPRAQWLPPIWGGGDEALPGDPAGSARVVEIVDIRREEIAGALLTGHLAYSPVYEAGDDGGYAWEPWIDGFSKAMALGGKDWDALLTTGDEDLATAFLGLTRFVLVAHGALSGLSEAEADLALDLIPYYAETIFRRQHGLARIALGQEPVRAGPKIGRNDPCPCGSGRKYKKCCGAA